MACKCPVCNKSMSAIGELVEHVATSQDNPHQVWLESYCTKNKIDFARMVLQQINGDKNASKPLASPMKKDFCNKQ